MKLGQKPVRWTDLLLCPNSARLSLLDVADAGQGASQDCEPLAHASTWPAYRVARFTFNGSIPSPRDIVTLLAAGPSGLNSMKFGRQAGYWPCASGGWTCRGCCCGNWTCRNNDLRGEVPGRGAGRGIWTA